MASLNTTTHLATDLEAIARSRAYERVEQVATTDRGLAAAQFKFAGVGDYSKTAASDPADIVILDLAVEEWLSRGIAVADLKEAHQLKAERKLAR